MTPEDGNGVPQSRDDVLRIIDMQVRRDIDLMRARQYWRKTLEETPVDVLVEALSDALATGRYQEVPKCRCCCRRG